LSSSICRPIEVSASPAGARVAAGGAEAARADGGAANGVDSSINASSGSAALTMREFSQTPTETPERLAASRATSRTSG
jgi:hypothetical protein